MRIPDRRPHWQLAAAALALAAAGAVPAGAAAPVKVPTSPYIVQTGSLSSSLAAVNAVISATGAGRLLYQLPLVDGVAATLSTDGANQLRQVVGSLVTPDAEVRTSMAGKGGPKPTPSPTPPPAPRQLGNVFRDVTGATRVAGGSTGAGIGVAVLDTGIAPMADFGTRLRAGVDYSGENNPQLDSFGHGTFVAGLIAGDGASDSSYVGEATGAFLVPVKVAGRSGATTMSNVIRGLQWIKDHKSDGIRVINMSVGAVPVSSTALNPLDQAVEAMWKDGFVVVASAGNNGPDAGTITSPGDDPLVITVGALNDKDTVDPADDTVPAFSSQGPTSYDGWWKPDLLAPGTSLVSVMPSTSASWGANRSARVGSKNFVGSGTSFAAAVTSGAAAILLQATPGAGPDEIKAALLTTTNQGPGAPNSPFEQGHGVLDVARAVDEPDIALQQAFGPYLPPAVGDVIPLVSTQLRSTWADPESLLYPFPYGGAATIPPVLGDPLFHSSAWSSAHWEGKAWNGATWDGKAWNDASWDSKAWNGKAWNSAAWS